MRFKHRIWLLPIMTAVIVCAGIAVNSRITSRASAALARVEQVQYPTVEALRSLRAHVEKIQGTLQQAVAEGDKSALNTAAQDAASVRNTLKQLATLDDAGRKLAGDLGEKFDAYYTAAANATEILLGSAGGDAASAIAGMQSTSQTLNALLASSNDSALADFRKLLSDGAADVRQTLRVSMIAAVIMIMILGVGSSVLIKSVFSSLGGEPEAAVKIVRRIADGDFVTSVELRSGDDSSLLHGISTLRSKLGNLILDVQRASNEVDAAAGNMHSAVSELSERTSGQAASLEETAASMEQMTATIKQNADSSRTATDLAIATRTQAEAGGEVVNRAVNAMSEINSSSKKIADIIGVIDEIAFQTNLLALNAAVEAARAGEQGRGFAVVATEVRNLAQRSSSAAREIKTLIQDSVGKVQDGQTLVNESGRHLNDIVTSVKNVADIISEMSNASREQSLGLDQVNKAVAQMDQITQQNSSMVDKTSAVAEAMTEQAKKLIEIIRVFRIEDDRQASSKLAVHMPARRGGSNPASSRRSSWQKAA